MLSDYIPGTGRPGCYHLGMLTAGFVLVGGQSRRMGQDKALLPWKSGVLVQEIATKLAGIAEAVTLIGDPARYSHLGYPCIPDLRPGLGPLSGIETALFSNMAELNFILACDMPQLQPAHLQDLLAAATRSQASCFVTADTSGTVHPLCAVYRTNCLPAVRSALNERRLKLMHLVNELRAEIIPAASLVRNINTVEDWNVLRTANGY